MPSEEAEGASPPWGSHPHGAKGLWALGGPTVSTVVGHRTGHKPCQEVGRGCGQTGGRWGVCVISA
jgi:hypothetical protein